MKSAVHHHVSFLQVELLNRKVLKKRVQQLMLKRPRHAMPVLFSAALLKVFPLMDAQQRLSSILYRKLSKFIQHIELVDVYFWILLHHGDSLRQAIHTGPKLSGSCCLVSLRPSLVAGSLAVQSRGVTASARPLHARQGSDWRAHSGAAPHLRSEQGGDSRRVCPFRRVSRPIPASLPSLCV